MSIILDALKKSENDRQRQSAPGMFEVKVAPPRARFPIWAVGFGALLGMALLALVGVLWRMGTQERDAAEFVVASTAANSRQATGAAGNAPTNQSVNLGSAANNSNAATVTVTGSRWKRELSERISGENVAENNRVWRRAGIWLTTSMMLS